MLLLCFWPGSVHRTTTFSVIASQILLGGYLHICSSCTILDEFGVHAEHGV